MMVQHSDCSHQGLISLDQALASYTQVAPLGIRELPLAAAHQHCLAADVISPYALPLFDQSAVDGYALRHADIAAGMRQFEVVGEVRAGMAYQPVLQAGQTVRIFTGGPLPDTASTVARQEIISRQGHQITLNSPLAPGCDIRYQGEELAASTVLARRGQRLHSRLIAALSMAGVQQVAVYQTPRIAVLITGDEVSSQLTHDAQVFDANGPLIMSWLHEQGHQSVHLQHVADDEQKLSTALQQALQHHDLVISTGGVSVGDYDLIRPVCMRLGARQVFWQVAQKPGKPLFFAEYQHNGHRSYLIGLPGNPAAVALGLMIHVRTLLNQLQGACPALPDWHYGKLASPLKPDSRELVVRMQACSTAQGEVILHPLGKQQSHMLSNMNQANALARIPAGKSCQANDILQFLWL